MPVGTTLSRVRDLLKAEVASSLTVGTASDGNYNVLIENKLSWFSAMYDWKELEDEWRTSVVANGEYTVIPVADNNGFANTINFDRPLLVEVQWTTFWQPVIYGIGSKEYNTLQGDDRQQPILRWSFKQGDRTRFRTWPIGTNDQTVRFSGQRNVATLRNGSGIFQDANTLDLDDLLIVYTIAAEILTSKKDPSANAKASLAQARFLSLRSAEPVRDDGPIIMGVNNVPRNKLQPIKVIASA